MGSREGSDLEKVRERICYDLPVGEEGGYAGGERRERARGGTSERTRARERWETSDQIEGGFLRI